MKQVRRIDSIDSDLLCLCCVISITIISLKLATKMKITVKKLLGSECNVEVLPTTSISEIKLEVEKQLGIPVNEQKLLLFGRTLADDQTVESYPINDGAKLNLVVKKPDGFYEIALKYFKKQGMTDLEATNSAKKLLKVVQEKFSKFSWDDIDRLALDCILDENGQIRVPTETETECEDTFSL